MMAPVILRPDQVPEDMVCSICMTLPTEPVLTPCEHMFCRGCINEALANGNQCCPIDRVALTLNQLKSLQGFVLRIWSGIQVKCGKHNDGCAWTGSIADYASHLSACDGGQSSNGGSAAMQQRIETLERENSRLREELESVQFTQAALSQETRVAELELENTQVKRDLDELREQLRNRPDVPQLFHGHYSFNRHDVVKLSQLISRYLENKPYQIDGNKIYNCVQACYRDLEKGYTDNPKHYWLDMKMLLATCEASTWFSDKQRDNIRQWFRKHYC